VLRQNLSNNTLDFVSTHKYRGGGHRCNFRGNLIVALFNHSKFHFRTSRGNKIATLICEKIYYSESDLLDKLDETTGPVVDSVPLG